MQAMPRPEEIGALELNQIRSRIVRILRVIDPQPDPNRRELMWLTIRRLCAEKVVPAFIGDLMHLVRKCRNLAEYEGWRFSGMQARVLLSADAAIEAWFNERLRSWNSSSTEFPLPGPTRNSRPDGDRRSRPRCLRSR